MYFQSEAAACQLTAKQPVAECICSKWDLGSDFRAAETGSQGDDREELRGRDRGSDKERVIWITEGEAWLSGGRKVNSTSIKLFKEYLTAPERKICQLHGAAIQSSPIEEERQRDGEWEHIRSTPEFRAVFLCAEAEYQ